MKYILLTCALLLLPIAASKTHDNLKIKTFSKKKVTTSSLTPAVTKEYRPQNSISKKSESTNNIATAEVVTIQNALRAVAVTTSNKTLAQVYRSKPTRDRPTRIKEKEPTANPLDFPTRSRNNGNSTRPSAGNKGRPSFLPPSLPNNNPPNRSSPKVPDVLHPPSVTNVNP